MASRNDHWIQGAIKPQHKGMLRRELGAKKGQPIPRGKLVAAAHEKGPKGLRARLALKLGMMRRRKAS